MRRDRVRRPEPPSHGGGWPGDPRAVLHPDHDEEPEGRVLEVGLPDGHHVHVQPEQPARRKESSWIRSWHQIASSRDAGNTSGCFWKKTSLLTSWSKWSQWSAGPILRQQIAVEWTEFWRRRQRPRDLRTLCHSWQVLHNSHFCPVEDLLVLLFLFCFDIQHLSWKFRLRKRSEDIYSSMRRPDGESDDDPYSRWGLGSLNRILLWWSWRWWWYYDEEEVCLKYLHHDTQH